MTRAGSIKGNSDRLTLTLLLGLLVSFAPITIDLYLPALPVMTADLMTNTESMQLTLSVYMVGFALAQTFFGPHLRSLRAKTNHSDRYFGLSHRQCRLCPSHQRRATDHIPSVPVHWGRRGASGGTRGCP